MKNNPSIQNKHHITTEMHVFQTLLLTNNNTKKFNQRKNNLDKTLL